MYRYFRPSSLLVAGCVLFGLVFVAGCVSDDDESKAVSEFQTASATLTQAFQAQLLSANVIEADNYIDSKVFDKAEINKTGIDATVILTEDEIKLRTSAIKALTDYTTALASLAAGKPAAQIQTDAMAASSSTKNLSADSANAMTKATKGSKTTDYGGPVSAAVAAIGDVLQIIEKHRGENEVKESLQKNDPQVQALYKLIAQESRDLYFRQKSYMGLTGVTLFSSYNTARKSASASPAELMALSDRIKQYEKDSVALSAADPSHAIRSFEAAHDALVRAILAPKETKKESFADVVAKVKAFASDVTPLGQNLSSVITAF